MKLTDTKTKTTPTHIEARTTNPYPHQIDCRTVRCRRKSFWIEADADGSPLLCFRARHDGANHAVKLSTERIEREMKEVGFTVTFTERG